MKRVANIPETQKKRVVIVGGGFAGLKLATSLSKKYFQVVLIDKNNYHQFQPLFYQVATAGLEPSAISFPLRKALQNEKHIHFRIAQLENIDTTKQCVATDLGSISYDYLVLALGATTNYFGNKNIEQHAIPMKSLSEAIDLRNIILTNFEKALNETDPKKQASLMNVVLVGGGPTGVELAGAIAEMKKFILPKDYPELDFNQMNIHLLEAADKILNGFSEGASAKGEAYLKRLGVKVRTQAFVEDYDGTTVQLKDGTQLETEALIWAAGIKANPVKGLEDSSFGASGRLLVDGYNRVKDAENVFAIGDLAFMTTEKYPKGHPQVAQVAIQQAARLSKNLKQLEQNKELKAFSYFDKGSLATVGRNLAVADLPGFSFQGFFAWVLWLFVHLMAILGVRNRMVVFLNWAWNYVTYDQSLRLLIRPKTKVADKDLTLVEVE